jgi:hypothetical protein
MRASTGLLAILVVALVAVASVPSPVKTDGWQEAHDPSGQSLWQVVISGLGSEPSRWRDVSEPHPSILPDPIGLLQGWLLWPLDTLAFSFW